MQIIKTLDCAVRVKLKLIVAQLNVIAAQDEIAFTDFNLLDKLTVQLQKLLEND